MCARDSVQRRKVSRRGAATRALESERGRPLARGRCRCMHAGPCLTLTDTCHCRRPEMQTGRKRRARRKTSLRLAEQAKDDTSSGKRHARAHTHSYAHTRTAQRCACAARSWPILGGLGQVRHPSPPTAPSCFISSAASTPPSRSTPYHHHHNHYHHLPSLCHFVRNLVLSSAFSG